MTTTTRTETFWTDSADNYGITCMACASTIFRLDIAVEPDEWTGERHARAECVGCRTGSDGTADVDPTEADVAAAFLAFEAR